MMKSNNDTSENRNKKASEFASILEEVLKSFNIKSKVQAVNFRKRYYLLEVDIAKNVRVEEVLALSRTIAMALSSPTGKVRIIAPIPGTSYIGIKIPKSRWIGPKLFQSLLTALTKWSNSLKTS